MAYKNLLIVSVLLFGMAFSAPVDTSGCEDYEEEYDGPTTGLYFEVVTLNGTPGPILEDGSSLCPDNYSGGFSIVCKGFADGTKNAAFYVDGAKVKTEWAVPYAIAGNIGNKYSPFKSYSKTGPTEIKCVTNMDESVVSKVNFSC